MAAPSTTRAATSTPPASAPSPRAGPGGAAASAKAPAYNEATQARRYGDYVKRQVRKGKTPLGRDQWEAKYGGRPHNPHGGKGNLRHQAAVRRLEALAWQEYPDARYEIWRESPIADVTTPPLRRVPDVAVYDKVERQIVKVYEAGRTEKSGRPVRYERIKQAEYEARGILYYFLAVKD